MPFTRFDRYVDRHANSFVERLQALCRMPSVAARGTGMRVMAERVEQSMQRVGAGTKTFKIGSGFPIIFGEFGAGNGKGDLVARLAAVEAYQKTFGKLPVCLRFVIEGEDGLGSPSLYRFTQEQGELLR